MTVALAWLAFGLLGVAIAAALGAVAARSLFVTCMHVVAAGASVAAMALLRGGGDGALALGLFAAAWAPVFFLSAILLSARASRGRRWPWLGFVGALAAACALWWPLGELGIAVAVGTYAGPSAIGLVLAPLVLVAAAACVGVLGYGERGAFSPGGRS